MSVEISQKDYQTILRNVCGKKVEEILGYNLFVPNDGLVKQLHIPSKSLKDESNLQFKGWNGTVVGFVDVKKTKWMLKHPTLQQSSKGSTRFCHNLCLH